MVTMALSLMRGAFDLRLVRLVSTARMGLQILAGFRWNEMEVRSLMVLEMGERPRDKHVGASEISWLRQLVVL